MSAKASFRQADVERALRAAKAVGYKHPTVDILPDGRLRLLTSEEAPTKALSPYEAWKAGNGDRAT